MNSELIHPSLLQKLAEDRKQEEEGKRLLLVVVVVVVSVFSLYFSIVLPRNFNFTLQK